MLKDYRVVTITSTHETSDCTKELPVTINRSISFKLGEIVKMFLDLIAISYRNRIKGSHQKKLNSIENKQVAHRMRSKW